MSESSASLFDIVFRGDILPGQQLPQVKQRLGQLFKADEQKINALFTGAAVPLKRNLEKAVADKYVAALNQAGADVQLLAAGQMKAKIRKPPAPRRPSAAAERKITPKKMSLAERLAAQEEAKPTEAEVEVDEQAAGLSLAPVGADVLKPEEREKVETVEVDVSGLSLRDAQGDLLDADERPVLPEVTVDIDDISLSELGGDLLEESEKRVLQELDLDLSDLKLAEPGVDLGQIKPGAPPPPPDISSIHLQE